jgi:hypothetical protein
VTVSDFRRSAENVSKDFRQDNAGGEHDATELRLSGHMGYLCVILEHYRDRLAIPE